MNGVTTGTCDLSKDVSADYLALYKVACSYPTWPRFAAACPPSTE